MKRRWRMVWPVLLVAGLAIQVTAEEALEPDGLCGTYEVQGWEPDGDVSSTPDYVGTTIISRRGVAHVFHGKVDAFHFEGIGFYEGNQVHFAYRGSDGDSGIMRGENKNGVWVCQWVSALDAAGKPGREIWKKKAPVPEVPVQESEQ